METNMLGSLVIALSLANSVSAAETAMCTGNHTLLDAPGDAVIAGTIYSNRINEKKNYMYTCIHRYMYL